jgi:hypothetical protein
LVTHAATLSLPCWGFFGRVSRHSVTRKCRSYVVTSPTIGSRQPVFPHAVRALTVTVLRLEYFRVVATPQVPAQVPAQYLLSPRAPSPRTLVDVLYDTAARYPDAAAIDDGTVQLT